MSADTSIYTIGHSNLEIGRFVSLLKSNAIEILVDIRSVPYSRYYPQYNKNAIERTMRENSIEYISEGARLGGRISDPRCYISGKLPDRKVRVAGLIDFEYLKTRSYFSDGISTLVDLAAAKRCALMCSEEDPLSCHRHLLVGRRLAELGVTVVHIRSKTPVSDNRGEALSLFE